MTSGYGWNGSTHIRVIALRASDNPTRHPHRLVKGVCRGVGGGLDGQDAPEPNRGTMEVEAAKIFFAQYYPPLPGPVPRGSQIFSKKAVLITAIAFIHTPCQL